MGIQALKKVVLITDEQSLSDLKRMLSNIRDNGMDLSIRNKEDKIEMEDGTLYITDLSEIAEKMAADHFSVLGCLTKRNHNAFFGGVKYLADAEEELEIEYLERVYRRYHDLPWAILTTDRCEIRETIETDLDAFYDIYAHSSITRYMEPLFADKQKEMNYITSYRKNVYSFYEYGIWTVLLKQTGEIIGRAGLTMREGFTEPELGFVIGKPWQNEGYAYEVCEAILNYGLRELHFYKVQAFTRPLNKASLGLLHKLGFRPAGRYSIEGIEHISLEKSFTQE